MIEIECEPPDTAWMLPDTASPGSPVTAGCFAPLLAAARAHGWPGIWRVWSEGYVTVEPTPSTGEPRKRPPLGARLLRDFLAKRPDLHSLLEDAANQRRDRLLNALENEAEKIALSEGDVTLDFGKSGEVTRKRVDVRNKLHAILKLLASHSPETYGDRKRVEVAGNIDHRHAHAHLQLGSDTGGYRVDFDSLEAALSLDERRDFIAMLDRIEAVRLERHRERVAEQNQRAALPGQVVSGDMEDE